MVYSWFSLMPFHTTEYICHCLFLTIFPVHFVGVLTYQPCWVLVSEGNCLAHWGASSRGRCHRLCSTFLIKETPCEANKISYPKLSYFTLNISKYTIRKLEDWRVSIHGFLFLSTKIIQLRLMLMLNRTCFTSSPLLKLAMDNLINVLRSLCQVGRLSDFLWVRGIFEKGTIDPLLKFYFIFWITMFLVQWPHYLRPLTDPSENI